MLLLAFPPAFAAETGKPRPSPLAAVKALEKPITLSESKIPLGELVQKVSAETGVSLTATPEVADEPVAAAVKEMPARRLLEEIADLLDYTWVRASRARSAAPGTPGSEHTGPAFAITQDVAARQREEALRQALFHKMEQQFRQQVAQYVEAAELSQDQIDAMRERERQEAKRYEKLTAAQRRGLQSASAERQLEQRLALAGSLAPPINRAMARLIGRLSQAQWNRLLREGEVLIFSTDPQRGELPLPRDIATALATAPPRVHRGDDLRFPDNPGAEERLRERERETHAQWSAANAYRVRLRVDAHPSISSFYLISEARFRSEQSPQFQGSGGGLLVSGSPRDQVTREQAEEDTAQRRAAGEKDPVLGIEKRFKPTAKPRVRGRDDDGSAGWSLWDLLPDLGRTYGVNFIADAYWTRGGPPLDASAATGQPTSLFRLLDQTAWFTHRWDRRGSLVRLRSRTWFHDRPREIPLRRVRQWQQLLDRHGALPLEEVLESVASLTDSQLAGLHLVVDELGLSEELSLIDPAQHALRLYASLSPAQQALLRSGQIVAADQLTPRQRGRLMEASGAQVRVRGVTMAPEEWAASSLQVSHSPFVRVREQRGGSITTTEESAASHDSASPPGVGTAPPVPAGVAKKATVTRYPLARLHFSLRYGRQLSEDFPLVIALPSGPVLPLEGASAKETRP